MECICHWGYRCSSLSMANGGIVFLSASALYFWTGLHRNTHCWTEKTAECSRGLYYQKLMEMTVGMVAMDAPYMLLNISFTKQGRR